VSDEIIKLTEDRFVHIFFTWVSKEYLDYLYEKADLDSSYTYILPHEAGFTTYIKGTQYFIKVLPQIIILFKDDEPVMMITASTHTFSLFHDAKKGQLQKVWKRKRKSMLRELLGIIAVYEVLKGSPKPKDDLKPSKPLTTVIFMNENLEITRVYVGGLSP